ncbi:MAG: hypothetical protein CSA33_06110 [Desulfobulbus propionicus]|nr:MAG: hypothetical protein CSA33_06110 [Desulfobulbus propionicus]
MPGLGVVDTSFDLGIDVAILLSNGGRLSSPLVNSLVKAAPTLESHIAHIDLFLSLFPQMRQNFIRNPG